MRSQSIGSGETERWLRGRLQHRCEIEMTGSKGVIVYITRCEIEMSGSKGVIVYITREEVPPTLMFLDGRLEGLWVFFVDPPL